MGWLKFTNCLGSKAMHAMHHWCQPNIFQPIFVIAGGLQVCAKQLKFISCWKTESEQVSMRLNRIQTWNRCRFSAQGTTAVLTSLSNCQCLLSVQTEVNSLYKCFIFSINLLGKWHIKKVFTFNMFFFFLLDLIWIFLVKLT